MVERVRLTSSSLSTEPLVRLTMLRTSFLSARRICWNSLPYTRVPTPSLVKTSASSPSSTAPLMTWTRGTPAVDSLVQEDHLPRRWVDPQLFAWWRGLIPLDYWIAGSRSQTEVPRSRHGAGSAASEPSGLPWPTRPIAQRAQFGYFLRLTILFDGGREK